VKTAQFSSALRHELALRNRSFAKRYRLSHQESYGSVPVIVYEPYGTPVCHGNFIDAAYRSICDSTDWRRRLTKIHSQARTALPKAERRWCELDSSMSSDALLMNVFCHPATLLSSELRLMLGIDECAAPEFGVRARVPLASGAGDRTEIDMRLGSLLVESKLTESDFQTKSKDVVEGYRDFATVFDHRLLPIEDGVYSGYQLIRNTLAAFATGASFCVLLDARRPDLIEQWYAVMRAVKEAEMRVRCKVLTWQELSAVVPQDLKKFLDEKYGIVPPGAIPPEFENTAQH
jgi:hypothetical protein